MGWMEKWGIEPKDVQIQDGNVKICGGKNWHLAFRAISSATDRRTVIAAILPGDTALSSTASTINFKRNENIGNYEES